MCADCTSRPEEREHPVGPGRRRMHRGELIACPQMWGVMQVPGCLYPHSWPNLRLGGSTGHGAHVHVRGRVRAQFFSEGDLGRPLCSATHKCTFPSPSQSDGPQDVGMARMLTKNVLTSLHGTFGEGTLLHGTAFKLCKHAVCDNVMGDGLLAAAARRCLWIKSCVARRPAY